MSATYASTTELRDDQITWLCTKLAEEPKSNPCHTMSLIVHSNHSSSKHFNQWLKLKLSRKQETSA